jgi:ankyrin repeat protein
VALRGGNDILQAAATGHLGGVRHLLRTVPGAVAATNRGGATALHCAADEGHAEICRVLLAAGAEVDARAEEGLSALKRWMHGALGRFQGAKKIEVKM